MSEVIVVATITPQEGKEQQVRDTLRVAVEKVHAEPGCELYALHEATNGSDFVMIEKWASVEALDAHGAAPALAELGGALADLLAAPLDVRTFTALPAGDASKGAL